MERAGVLVLTGVAGFVDGTAPEEPVDGLARGSKDIVFVGPGKMAVAPGHATATGAAAVGQGSAVRGFLLGGYPATMTGATGSAVVYRKNYILAVGGTLASTHPTIGTSASVGGNTPQIIFPTGDVEPLEIAEPGAPTVITAADGTMQGSRTFKITHYRTSTRGESNASEASDVLTPTEGMRKAQFNETDPDGVGGMIDRFRIYSSYAGFPQGPHFLLKNPSDIEFNAWTFGSNHNIDVRDEDLLSVLAPISYFTPPDAAFITSLGGFTTCVGCYDAPTGHYIHPSIFLRPESFDPDAAVGLSPQEPVVGILDGMSDGVLLIIQENAINGAVLSGGASIPIIPRNVWKGVGCSSEQQMCAVHGEIYAWTRQKGLVRSGANGEPDTLWTEPVREFLDGFTGDCVVGYDAKSDTIVVGGAHSDPFGSGAGSCILRYNRGISNHVWNAPESISITPAYRFEYQNSLYFGAGATVLEIGGGGVVSSGIARFFPQNGGAPGYDKTVTDYQVSVSAATATVAITTGHAQAAAKTYAGVTVSDGNSKILPTFARGKTIGGQITAAAGYIYRLVLHFLVDEARR